MTGELTKSTEHPRMALRVVPHIAGSVGGEGSLVFQGLPKEGPFALSLQEPLSKLLVRGLRNWRLPRKPHKALVQVCSDIPAQTLQRVRCNEGQTLGS